MNFLENKCAKILAFDEVIGINSDYEGNTHENVIRETKNIIKFLLDKECFTDKIDSFILSEFNKIIDDTIILDSDNSYDDEFNLTNDIDDLNKKKIIIIFYVDGKVMEFLCFMKKLMIIIIILVLLMQVVVLKFMGTLMIYVMVS